MGEQNEKYFISEKYNYINNCTFFDNLYSASNGK